MHDKSFPKFEASRFFSLGQFLLEFLAQLDAGLELVQGFFQRQLPVFQVVDDHLQLVQLLFKIILLCHAAP